MAKIVAPPSALDAEEMILGNILNNPNTLDKAAGYIVEDEVFYDDRNKLLWSKIKKMINRGEVVDQITVISDLSEKEKNDGLNAYYITGLTTSA